MKKRIWKWLTAMSTFAVLSSCQATLRPYASEARVTGTDECRRFLTETVSSIRGPGRHEFYVTGEDYEPETLAIAQFFPEVVNISNTKIEVTEEDGHRYTTCRIGFERLEDPGSCEHVWETEVLEETACLHGGKEHYFCRQCGAEETVATAARGHVDTESDRVCDRCGTRFVSQKEGDRISVVLADELEDMVLTFTCIREEYGDGMLYACDSLLSPELALRSTQGLDGTPEEKVRWWLATDFANNISARRACLGVLLLDGEGDIIEDGNWAMEDQIRPGIVLTRPKTNAAHEKTFWSVGDIQVRSIGGIDYRFRCIDDDYGDTNSNYQKSALFLCETVIRSDIDSTDSEREILPFGETNNYKKSNVREWLIRNQDSGSDAMLTVQTGVNTAFSGKTPDGTYAEFAENDLRGYRLTTQIITDQLFLLSVEEAFEYRDELWNVSGGQSAYDRGYWLRTPAYEDNGNGVFAYGDQEYVVDLDRGCIRPAQITDGGIGIRPAFCLPQA